MSATTPASVEQKTCTHCKTTKPRDAFAGNASNADGLQRHCRQCMRTMRSRGADKAPAAAGAVAPAGSILASLPLSAIVASLTNPRRHFHPARLAELTESIKASGVHQPVLVRPLPGSRVGETFQDRRKGDPLPTHEIIAGERRYRASQLAGMATIPVLITSMTDDKVLELQIVENLQRDDLHPMEEAEGYQRLCDATGITKDDIGAKIGKSRSYVYQRIKLLDLAQAARDAFLEGKLDMSRALIIARCPDTKLQLKALTEATREDWRGDVASVRTFQMWAQQNIMLKLDAARFKITDASLVPEAGSCDQCPKRTGASPDLFADVDSADVCIDPACFHSKSAAHEAIVIAQAKAKGQQVILEKEAKKLWEWEHSKIDGYTRVDRPDPRVGGSKLLKTVLGKDMPQPIIMQNPHKKGELIEVLPTSKVTKLLKDSGKIAAAPRAEKPTETDRPIEERRDYNNRWQEETLRRTDAHFKGRTGEIPASLLRAFLVNHFEMADEGPFGPALDLGTGFNTADVLHRLNTLPDSAMPEVFVRWLLHDSEDCYPSPWTTEQRNRTEPRHPTWEIIKLAGVDVDAIQAETKRAIESDERAAELAKAEKSAAAKMKGQSAKKLTAPPAAQKVRARKPSAAEVQAQIAEQLQALEESQNQAPGGAEPEEGAAVAAGGNDQAPGGASEEEGAAPAAPAIAKAAPQIQVGDRVAIDLEGDLHHGMEGVVTKAISTGRYHVDFGATGNNIFRASSLKVLAAALWPFPNTPPAKLPLDIGTRVKVKETLAGTGGEHAGKEGTVSGQVVGKARWQVKFPGRGGKASKIVEFDTDMLQVVA